MAIDSKTQDIERSFTTDNHYQWRVNSLSYDYRYKFERLNELIKSGRIIFIKKVRQMITYRLVRCLDS